MIPASPKWRVAWRIWIVLSVLWVFGSVGYVGVVSPETLTGERDGPPVVVLIAMLIAAPWVALVSVLILWRAILMPVLRWIGAPLRGDR